MPDQDTSRSHEKTVIAAVAAIGLVTMVFGFMSLRKSIYEPFVKKDAGYKTPSERQEEALEALKLTDTDSDKLSDYDELYIFQTNPYLEDTDSDGISDSTEISQNSDPNCPQGQTCRVARAPSSGSSTPTGSLPGSDVGLDTEIDTSDLSEEERATLIFVKTFGDPAELTLDEAIAKINAMSADELRTFFIEMGVPASTVNQADEQSLRNLAEEALTEISFQANPSEESEE